MNFSKYDIVKCFIYILGFGYTIYAILKFGLIDSHTPPVGFAIPVFLMIVAVIWYVLDLVILKFFKKQMINKDINLWGLMINFLIVFFIITDFL